MRNTKILCVDDDEKILNGILRQQGDDFDITIAHGPLAAIELIEREGPFAVVLSDMRMPEMNGVELFKRIRQLTPNTVRMILTGFADLKTTIEAVNEGHIFRFLSKPCEAEDLAASLEAALRQYALVEAEKELVEGTLHGSVKVLCDVLSLVNPMAFGQSTRIREVVDGILKRVHVEDQWQIEIAAMLSSLGCVTLPSELLQKKFSGEPLSEEESTLFEDHPAIAAELIRSIPRLDQVAEIIAQQGALENSDGGDETPLENQILRLATEFDLNDLKAESSMHALAELRASSVDYSEELMEALTDYVATERNLRSVKLRIHQLSEGMVLAEDITCSDGTLLMSKGQRITSSASRLLDNFAKQKSIIEPIMVAMASPACETAAV